MDRLVDQLIAEYHAAAVALAQLLVGSWPAGSGASGYYVYGDERTVALLEAYRAAKVALEPKPEPDWIDRAVDGWMADAPVGLDALKRRLRDAQP